jgi:deoxyribose-phosphate aldolase
LVSPKGYGPWGCKIGDIRMMKRILGDKVKIKAASGLKDINQAMAVIDECVYHPADMIFTDIIVQAYRH